MSKAGTYSNQGDDYQRAIALKWIIELLIDNSIDYVQAESNGLLGINDKVTVDDIVIVYKNGLRRHIQAKKNQTQERSWSIKDWGSELPKILMQLEQGQHIQVELYSSTPLGEFATLSKSCRLYPNFKDFKRELSNPNSKGLSTLSDVWQRSELDIFSLLKRLHIGPHHTTGEWYKINRESLNRIVTHPSLAIDVLEAFVNKHQSKDLTDILEIRSSDIRELISEKGLTFLPSYSEEYIISQFNRISAIGRTDWKRTIAGQKIERKELNDILNHIKDLKNTILVQDKPGSGKTCLLLDLADSIETDSQYQLLFLKGDRYIKDVSNGDSLPKELIECCGLLSCNKHVIVIIDSLDVLSCHRDHVTLNYFLNLIDQLQIIKNVTVVAACREFDLRYDPKLRNRKWDIEIKLKNFEFENTVRPILSNLEVNIDQITIDLRELLCLPQNLSLFERICKYKGVFNVRTSYDLHSAFIDYTLRQEDDIKDHIFEKIFLMVNTLQKERVYSLPKTTLKMEEHILQSLISKGILNEEAERKIGFSHQTLFDNFVAIQALQSSITLSDLILKHPPLPFYRPFVRSYLFFVRSHSFRTFSRNIRDTLLNEEIAYHFKRLIVETYAEIIPSDSDWGLIRWMFQYQNELFKRFFLSLKTYHWFNLIVNKWYPSLSYHQKSSEWGSIFIRKLDIWMNTFPTEIVELWNHILNEDFGKNNVWIISNYLSRFSHYNVNGVKDLVYLLKKYNDSDSHFMGAIYCNYIEATGEGYEILWNWISRDIPNKEMKIGDEKIELHCDNHDLKDKTFLEKHLKISDEFRNLVLKSVLEWIKDSYNWEQGMFTYKLLEYTSISDHSRFGSVNFRNISILIEAIEKAILYQASINSEWWKKEEILLRNQSELSFRYILIVAYLENIENNLNGITSQLLDKKLIESNELNYELGLLINKSFHLLSEQVQDKITDEIFNLFSKYTEQEAHINKWQDHVRFNLFVSIPAYLRSESVNFYLNKYIPQFGYVQPSRRIYSSGGFVGSPVDPEILDRLSPETLYKLINYYKDYSGHSFHPADGNRGGFSELSRSFCNLAKNNPLKYLNLIQNPLFEEFSESIIKAILEGVSYHISCRTGKVSDSSYKPIDPLPDINEITKRFLDMIIMKHISFINDVTYARMLRSCCEVQGNSEDIERIITLLIPLSNNSDPDGKKLNIYRVNVNTITVDDLLTNSINCTRGIVGGAAIEILNLILDSNQISYKSITNIIFKLAKDKALEVRASLLQNLAYTGYKNKELGWQIFNTIFDKTQTHLWALAERFLYNQYYNNFEMVKPCLDRIKKEAINEAGATWGRLSALCMIQGHINKQEFFNELDELNIKDAWQGALSVFIANIEKNPNGVCQESFRELLKDRKIQMEFGHKFDRAFSIEEKGKFINIDTGILFINSLTLDEDKAPKIQYFLDWIEYQAITNPIITLELCEILLYKLQSLESEPRRWHSEPLISTLTAILREADEMDDLELINRAVHLQDQFLILGIDGMDKYFEDATLL